MNGIQGLSRRQFIKLSSAIGFTAALAACAAPAAPPSDAAPAASGGDTAAAPAGGAKAEVARQDTLVHWGGDTEIVEPANFNRCPWNSVLDFGLGRPATLFIARGHDHVGALGSQRMGTCEAQSTVRSGDDDGLARQVLDGARFPTHGLI